MTKTRAELAEMTPEQKKKYYDSLKNRAKKALNLKAANLELLKRRKKGTKKNIIKSRRLGD